MSSSTWIESHVSMRTHKKLKPFCDDLGLTRRDAIGLLHLLWWWVIENREDGDLSNLYDRDIANACDWDRDPTELIKALHKHKWLVDYKVNDWMDYAGKLIKDRQRKRLRTFHGNSTEHSMESSTEIPRNETRNAPRNFHGAFHENSAPTVPNLTIPNQKPKDKILGLLNSESIENGGQPVDSSSFPQTEENESLDALTKKVAEDKTVSKTERKEETDQSESLLKKIKPEDEIKIRKALHDYHRFKLGSESNNVEYKKLMTRILKDKTVKVPVAVALDRIKKGNLRD